MAQAYGGMTCFSCGRPWGDGCACQFCNQMAGFPLGVTVSTASRRFVGYLLEVGLCLATLVIGWLIWSLVIYGNGQSPAKQLLGMRVVNIVTGTRAGWGRMFVREHLAKGVIGMVAGCLIFPYFWLLWDKNKQQLWDKIIDTAVVEDPTGLVGTEPQPGAGAQYGHQQQQQQYQLPQGQPVDPWGQPGQQGGYAQPGQQGGYGQPGQQGGYGNQGGYGQSGGYGQPGGTGRPDDYPPPSNPPQR